MVNRPQIICGRFLFFKRENNGSHKNTRQIL